MAAKKKIIFNPLTGQFDYVLDDKNYTHRFSIVTVLDTDLDISNEYLVTEPWRFIEVKTNVIGVVITLPPTAINGDHIIVKNLTQNQNQITLSTGSSGIHFDFNPNATIQLDYLDAYHLIRFGSIWYRFAEFDFGKPRQYSINLDSTLIEVSRVFSGGKTTFTIAHNYNNQDFVISVRELATNEEVIPTIIHLDNNNLEIEFIGNIPDNTYRMSMII
jgi:hypothetical protein